MIKAEKELQEWETRKNKIDILLLEQGWDIKDRTKVVLEVDTKQSDFKARNYKTVDETLENKGESEYADYLLLDKSGESLAIIEAKKTSKDPIAGQTQSEDYADDIKKQTGKDVFIFLTNGYEIWFWNRPFENPRMIKGFHNQESLERIRFQNYAKKSFKDVKINEKIIDRPYQIEAVKRVLEGIEKGKRKFLIVQATGTGKTRVAMSLIDILMRSNRAQKILFLADRIALRDQAYNDGLKKFFPNESKQKIFSGRLDKTARLYASTIQTFMEFYQEFSSGDFDLIISDESHRSIYNKWKDVFTYFDAIQIGLTATPSELIERDTFRFFECEDKTPTSLYAYEEAVENGWLSDFRVFDAQTHFQIEGIKPRDVPNQIKKKLLEEGICESEEELSFEGTDIEKKVVIIGTNEAIIKEFMDNCLLDETGTLPAKTILFAVSKKHAKRLWEAFEKLYPEYKGKLARIIVSDDPRAQELIKQFKTESWPRIAISVDMLDTGVDVPEVCNLAFVKPVFSRIKFWQMIGRGTRTDSICEHREWLPESKKEYFLIFDFWNNFEWFNMHPKGKEAKLSEAITSRIFLIKLQQYKYFSSKKDNEHIQLLRQKIVDDVKALPKESISVKENMRYVELASSPKLWDRVGLDPVEFLRKKITPLMRFQKNVNINESSFALKVERLALAILNNDEKEIERLKESIGEMLNCLPTTIKYVKEKSDLLDKVLSNYFWKKVSYEDTLMLLKEFAPLMKYKRTEPRPPIILDIDDIVQKRRIIEYGPALTPLHEYAETYMDKVEKKIKELADKHPTIQKIKRDEVITEKDLEKLEKALNSPELYVTEDVLKNLYNQHKGTLVQFIKKIIGLYEFPDPQKKIAEAFKTFLIEKNYLNANQVNFIRTLQTVFMSKHHIEYKDFFEPPFTNFGINAPVPLFKENELKEIVSICNNLETEFFRK